MSSNFKNQSENKFMRLNYKNTAVIVFMLLGILANGQSSLNVVQASHLSYGNQTCANIYF